MYERFLLPDDSNITFNISSSVCSSKFLSGQYIRHSRGKNGKQCDSQCCTNKYRMGKQLYCLWNIPER